MRSSEAEAGRSGRTIAALILAVAAAAATGSAAAQAPGEGQTSGKKAAPAPGLKFTLERLGNFAYAGDPVLVRVAVFNTAKTAYANSGGIDLVGSLSVIDQSKGEALKARQGRSADGRSEPQVLPPGGFFGYIKDLRDVVEGLEVPGHYDVRLAAGETPPELVTVVVIPPYDPATAYRATIDTDYGKLAFDLLGKEAPHHVQNFYNLANQGYYDGTLFHAIVKGIEIHGGDKTGNARSSPGYTLEPEISPDLHHKRGSLSMFRTGSRDHGSLFVISLTDSPNLDGALTMFGSLATGDDTLTALENLPTTGTRESPPYRPLQPARIRSIRVAPAPKGSAATAAGTSKPEEPAAVKPEDAAPGGQQ